MFVTYNLWAVSLNDGENRDEEVSYSQVALVTETPFPGLCQPLVIARADSWSSLIVIGPIPEGRDYFCNGYTYLSQG